MKTNRLFVAALAALLAGLAAGCVSHTTVKNEPRQSVRFASPEAAQNFYDAYLSGFSPTGKGTVAVYVPPPYWHRTVSSDNVRFNTAVQSADLDHNDVISDEEAQAFAVKAKGRLAKAGN